MASSKTDQLIQHLSAQVQRLEQIIQDQGTLGLNHGRRFIYIQNTKRSLWSFIADDEPVKAVALTGYVIDIYRKEDDVPKLHVVMRTRDEDYVLCSGFETHFSRDVLAAIAQLTPEQALRPLKIVPCLKDIKRAKGKEETPLKKPVYANVLLDEQTLYTYQLKKKFSADELFCKAQAVLNGNTDEQQLKAVSKRPKSLNITQFSASQPKPSQVIEPDNTTKTLDSVDWKGFCRQHGILPGVLKALAQELGLPMGKLNPRQSALLYHQAYARFVGVA